uniref:Uncharacterized protein n=1 Tax=Rhizophora mucronata TaxID=61149 RepID=A0A2P2Q1Q1_RHIMU
MHAVCVLFTTICCFYDVHMYLLGLMPDGW